MKPSTIKSRLAGISALTRASTLGLACVVLLVSGMLGGCKSAGCQNCDGSAGAEQRIDAPAFALGAPQDTRILAHADLAEAGVGQSILSGFLARGVDCGEIEPETAIEAISVAWGTPKSWRLEVGGTLEPAQLACLIGVDVDDEGASDDGRVQFVALPSGGAAMVTPTYKEAGGSVDEELLDAFAEAKKTAGAAAALMWQPEQKPALVSVAAGDEGARFRFLFADAEQFARFAKKLDGFLSSAPRGVKTEREVNRERREVSTTVGTAGMAWFVRRGLVEMFRQSANSMMPTMAAGEHFAVIKPPLIFEPIAAGDVVVFEFPQNAAVAHLKAQPSHKRACIGPEAITDSPAPQFVKRVVAVGGQTVEIRKNRLFVDGEPTHHEFVEKETTGNFLYPHRVTAEEAIAGHTYRVQYSGADPTFGPIDVPADHVFVLGDNRDNSSDSRCWGVLPTSKIVGRVEAIVWAEDDGEPNWYRIGQGL